MQKLHAACTFLCALFFAIIPSAGFADDARLIRLQDTQSELVEEAFLEAGRETPLLEKPYIMGPTRSALLDLDITSAQVLAQEMSPPAAPFLFDSAFASSLRLSNSPEWTATLYPSSIFAYVPSATLGWQIPGSSSDTAPDTTALATFRDSKSSDRSFYDAVSMKSIMLQSAIIDARVQFNIPHLALDMEPSIQGASTQYRTASTFVTNMETLIDPRHIDVNIPRRGIVSFDFEPFAARIGRDQIHLGPGRSTGLSFNNAIPWADFVSARANIWNFSFSWYLIRLNPILTDDERYYMDAIYDFPSLNPDSSAFHELIQREAEKNLAIFRFTWRITPWATVAVTQHNLVAGRSMQISDFSPLIIWHNLFQEGVYSVPAMIEGSVTPIKDLRVYAQYLLYDLTVADETGSDTNNAPSAAYLFGLTTILRPFKEALSGWRIRCDAEFVLTSPWAYGKALSLRQFTSRFVFVEPYSGRLWVDYPIGPVFGPDAWCLDLRLSIGKPDEMDLAFHPRYLEKGSINMVGYGPASAYAHQSNWQWKGLVMVRPDEAVEHRFTPGFEGSATIGSIGPWVFSVAGSIDPVLVWNFGCTPGAFRAWMDAGIAIKAAFSSY